MFGSKAVLLPPAHRMISATLRTTVAALGVFAVYKLGYSVAISATLGLFVSFPAVVIAGGSWLMYHGATAVVASLATNSFATLGVGLASLFGGYIALEQHDFVPFFGLVDNLIVYASKSWADPLAKYIAK